jgi:hypothetical protein
VVFFLLSRLVGYTVRDNTGLVPYNDEEKKGIFSLQEFLAYGKSNDGPGTPDFSSQLKVSENRENISPIRFVFQTRITAKVVGHHEEQALRVLGFLSSQFLK